MRPTHSSRLRSRRRRDNVTVAVVDVVDDDHPAVVDMTDMGIDLTPPEKITDQLPIVGRSVVEITDRPEDGPREIDSSENGHGPHPPSLADEPVPVAEDASPQSDQVDDTQQLHGVVGAATAKPAADRATKSAGSHRNRSSTNRSGSVIAAASCGRFSAWSPQSPCWSAATSA